MVIFHRGGPILILNGISSKRSAYLASAFSAVIHCPFFLVFMHYAIVDTDTSPDYHVYTKLIVSICLGNKAELLSYLTEYISL